MELIFFDIDGTLIDEVSHTVPQSTVDTLHQLQQQGHRLFISTGRSLKMLKHMDIHNLIAWDGFVCNNGQMVFDGNEDIILADLFSKETTDELIAVANKEKDSIFFQHLHTPFRIGDVSEHMIQAHEYFREPIPKDLTGNIPYDDIIMAIAYEKKDATYASYRDIQGVEVHPGVGTWADITKSGVSKHRGIQAIMDIYHKDSYIAFGDSMNDYDMLKHARIGVAMGNAVDPIKEVADYTTTSVRDDGILNACKHLELIP